MLWFYATVFIGIMKHDRMTSLKQIKSVYFYIQVVGMPKGTRTIKAVPSIMEGRLSLMKFCSGSQKARLGNRSEHSN